MNAAIKVLETLFPSREKKTILGVRKERLSGIRVLGVY